MKIHRLEVRNFRTLASFELEPGGEHCYLIGENGAGKSSVLVAIARVLGAERGFARRDFSSIDRPIEITVILGELTATERGELADAVDFDDPPSLMLKMRATWDVDLEEVDVEHILPTKNNGRKLRAYERRALAAVYLPADRDVRRMLSFGMKRSLAGSLLAELDITGPIRSAVAAVESAGVALGEAEALQVALESVGERLREVHSQAGDGGLRIGGVATTDREVLGQLEVRTVGAQGEVGLREQSSGVAQLLAFAFLAGSVQSRPGAVLVIDEPEGSLHPHAQRAVMRMLQSIGCQVVLATHSSNLLDKADPRRVVRLARDEGGALCFSPTVLAEGSARRFARFTNPETAEAFFARRVVLVEGDSDKLALEALADRRGVNLDADGTSVVALDGADTVATFLKLYGEHGLGLRVFGLCDADKEVKWRGYLGESGYGTMADRQQMQERGFFVADADLEDELISDLGEARVVELIEREGDAGPWGTFQQQPKYRNLGAPEQLRKFISKRGRKVRYAPILVDALDLDQSQTILNDVIDRLRP